MPRALDERGERGFLAIAEARLAFDFENGRNGDAERALELAVGVDERLVEPAGELAAERGFARARKTHQIQIAPMQIHRGIVVENRRARPAAAGARYLTAVTVSLTIRGVRKISSSVFSVDRPVLLNR